MSPLLWASLHPPERVSHILVASAVGRLTATWTWTGSPFSPVQKKMMYGPSRNRLGIDSSAFVGKTQDERGIVTHEIIEFFEVRFAKALV